MSYFGWNPWSIYNTIKILQSASIVSVLLTWIKLYKTFNSYFFFIVENPLTPNVTNEALQYSPNKSTGKYTHENTGSFLLYFMCTYVTVKRPDGSEHLTSDSKGPGSNHVLVCHYLYHPVAHAINIFVKFMQTNFLLQKHLMGSTGLQPLLSYSAVGS